METFPDNEVRLALFENVTNAADIAKLLMKGQLQYSFIDARMVSGDLEKSYREFHQAYQVILKIADTFEVLVAANKACHADLFSKFKTRNLYSELVYNLSPNTNVSATVRPRS